MIDTSYDRSVAPETALEFRFTQSNEADPRATRPNTVVDNSAYVVPTSPAELADIARAHATGGKPEVQRAPEIGPDRFTRAIQIATNLGAYREIRANARLN